MTGGRFLLGLEDKNCFETLVTLRSILKEDINLFESNVLRASKIDSSEAALQRCS